MRAAVKQIQSYGVIVGILMLFAVYACAANTVTVSAQEEQRLIRQLSSEDWILQAEALARLGEGKVKTAQPAIVKLFEEAKNLWIKREALVALARLGADGVYAETEKLAGATDPNMRLAAARALTFFGTEQAALAGRKLLKDDSPAVRMEAAIACAKHYPQEASPVIDALIGNHDPSLAVPLARALVRMGTDAALLRLSSLYDSLSADNKKQLQIIATLREGDQKTIPIVIQFVVRQKSAAPARSLGLDILESHDVQAVTAALLSVFESEKSDQYETAAIFTSVLCPSKAIGDAISALLMKKNALPSEAVRACLQTLTRIDAKRYIATFDACLARPDPTVRELAVRCRALCSKDDLFEVFRTQMMDQNSNVVRTAMTFMAEIPQGVSPAEGVVEYLKGPLQNHDREIQLAAMDIIGERGTPGEYKKARDLFSSVLGGDNYVTLGQVAETMFKKGGREKGRAWALFISGGEDGAFRQHAADVLLKMGGHDKIPDIACAQGYVARWKVVGPFLNDKENSGYKRIYPPELEVNNLNFTNKYKTDVVLELMEPEGKAKTGKKNKSDKKDGETGENKSAPDVSMVEWQDATVMSVDGKFNLGQIMPPPSTYVVAYGVADINSSMDMQVHAHIQFNTFQQDVWDNSYMLWVNGEKVAEWEGLCWTKLNTTMSLHPAPRIKFPLKAGRNRLMIKVANRGGPWWFRFRILDANDKVLP